MAEKTVTDHQGKKQPADTAKEGGAAYAPQQDEPHQKGDDRAPNKPVGEVANANRHPARKKTGES